MAFSILSCSTVVRCPADLVKTIVDRGLTCSMLASTITGPAWKRHLRSKEDVEKKKAEGKAEGEKAGIAPAREKTTAERRKEAATSAQISRCVAPTRRN